MRPINRMQIAQVVGRNPQRVDWRGGWSVHDCAAMQGCELLSVPEMGEADRLAIAGGERPPADGARPGGRWPPRRCACSAARRRLRRLWAWQQRRRRLRRRQASCASRLSRAPGLARRHRGTSRRCRRDGDALGRGTGGVDETSTCDCIGGAGDLIIDALFGAGLSRPLQGRPPRSWPPSTPAAKPSSPSTCRAGSMAAPGWPRVRALSRRAPSPSSA